MKILGCIFDMDGLMFDTERLCVQAMQIIGQNMGYDFLSELPNLCGMNDREEELVYIQRYGIDFDYRTMRNKRTQWISNYILRNGMPVKAGLYELLNTLRNHHIPMAVASSSYERIVRRNLALTNTESFFDAVICGDMVEKSKPDPQIFEVAAASIGTVPSQTIVFEDSCLGIRAAVAGGFQVCMIPDLQQPDAEIEKLLTARFETLADAIPFVLANICGQ